MALLAFGVLAFVAVASALGLVLRRNPIHGALFLVVNLASIAAFYLTLGAEFLAAAQVIVYAGAIMVLFVFVIMLLNAGSESKKGRSYTVQLLGVPLLIAFFAIAAYAVQSMYGKEAINFGGFQGGGPKEIGEALFTTYLLPFEVTSVLILIAIIGAVVLARKEVD